MKTLPSGTIGFYDSNNKFVAIGSSMGRKSWRGHDANIKAKCSLRKLNWLDGGYDQYGAYWGYISGTHIYWCNFDIGDTNEDIFVRATSREDAKAQVRERLPNARFYN